MTVYRMQVSKKIPFDDPQVLMGVRALYIVSNLIIFAVYFYTGMQIKKKKGEWPGVGMDPTSPAYTPAREPGSHGYRPHNPQIPRTCSSWIRRRA